MKRNTQDPLEAGLHLAGRNEQDCSRIRLGAQGMDYGIIRGQAALAKGCSRGGDASLAIRKWHLPWRHGCYRRCSLQFTPRSTPKSDRKPRCSTPTQRAKWNTLQFCECKPRCSTTVTVVCKGHETRQCQSQVLPPPTRRASRPIIAWRACLSGRYAEASRKMSCAKRAMQSTRVTSEV